MDGGTGFRGWGLVLSPHPPPIWVEVSDETRPSLGGPAHQPSASPPQRPSALRQHPKIGSRPPKTAWAGAQLQCLPWSLSWLLVVAGATEIDGLEDRWQDEHKDNGGAKGDNREWGCGGVGGGVPMMYTEHFHLPMQDIGSCPAEAQSILERQQGVTNGVTRGRGPAFGGKTETPICSLALGASLITRQGSLRRRGTREVGAERDRCAPVAHFVPELVFASPCEQDCVPPPPPHQLRTPRQGGSLAPGVRRPEPRGLHSAPSEGLRGSLPRPVPCGEGLRLHPRRLCD